MGVSRPFQALESAKAGPALFCRPVNLKGGAENGESRKPCEGRAALLRVQAAQLQHQEEQAQYHRAPGAQQVLPLLQKAHEAHRNQVMGAAQRKEGLT